VKPRTLLAIVAALTPLATLAACGSARGGAAQRAGKPALVAAKPALVAAAGVSARKAGSAREAASPSSSAVGCGAEAPEALAQAVGLVGRRIYANELASGAVYKDKHQVESYGPLLSALEGGSRAAIKRAVTSLVYSHTHIVRLRVTRGSKVLADVGGPYIIAPTGGALRRNGRTLGHYVLSVQDDLGYVKLVHRFIGVPLALSVSGHALPVEGAVPLSPAAIPAHGPVSYRGGRYQAYSFTAKAFPSGSLHIALLAPLSASLSNESCTAIRVAELGRVAERIAHRFTLSNSNFGSYIETTVPLTRGLIYIRSGSRQLAGSSRPGPAGLPSRGTVRYRGSTYGVSSFTAPSQAGRVRVYQLVHP
jgi:hypothetical protein